MASSKSELESAITGNDLSRVEKIIADARETDRYDSLLQEGLTVSCEKNHLRIVQRLVLLGADYTRNFGKRRRPPLILAVELDHRAVVRHLLESDNCNDETKNKRRRALLRRGLLGAKSKAVGELLIDHGADINHRDEKEKNRTLLMTIRNPKIVELLIEKGVDVEMKDEEGNTALMWTLREDESPAIAKVLIDVGKANINTTDNQRRTLLSTAIWKSRVEVVRKLVEDGVDIHAKDKRGRNALHHLAADKARKYQFRGENGSFKDESQKEADTSILRLLLDTKIDPGDQDNTGRTALHWAASLGSSGVLELLLQSRRFDVNALEQRSKTPLHLAATNGDLKSVDVLLREHDIDVNAESDGDWTVLHSACASKVDPAPVVQKLISKEASVQRRTRTGLTPLHIAAEAGNVSIVRLLLDHPDVKRTARDGFGNTPLLSGAKTRHRNRDDIIKLFAPWNNIHTLSDDAKDAAKKFNATVVDFAGNRKSKSIDKSHTKPATTSGPEKTQTKDHAAPGADRPQATKRTPSSLEKSQAKSQTPSGPSKPKPPKIQSPSVFDLLYETHSDDENRPKIKTAVDERSSDADGFRWIHFPTNNVSWCLDLFTKHFVEEGGGDWNSFRALERSFNHQHHGREPQARYMTPLCQTVMRPWGDEEVGWEPEEEIEGPPSRKATFDERRDPAIQRVGGTEVPHVSFGTIEDASGNVESLSPTEPISMHFPNERPAESQRRPSIASRPSNLRRSSYLQSNYGLPKEDLRRNEDTGPVTDFYVFMPYLHFETYDQRQEMRNSYSRILHSSSGKQESELPPRRVSTFRSELTPSQALSEEGGNSATERDHTLFRAFLDTSEQTLHIRRTLDQSFYHHINTKERDKTQVIHRFQKHLKPDCKPKDHKVLMVDQLWLYVIGRKLVVTCFPQRWKQPKKDPLNVLDSILAIVNQPNREPVHNVYELAMIITGRCYGAFDRHGIGSDDVQFLDMFEGWIGAAMDDEVKLFKRFLKDSAKASKWLQTAKLRDFKRIKDTDEPSERSERDERFTILKPPSTTRSDFVKNLLDIGSETELLGEIKDIQDELDMLSLVFSHQAQVLQGIREAIELIKKHEHLPQVLHQLIRKAFDDHRRTIQHPQTEIRRMHGQAGRMYDSIRDLLDLKQKHANAIEARFAREQQYDTSQQGRTLMIFTIFTVVFLPLTFVAALFAIDIKELPHIGGVQVLPAGYVAKYTFGLGAAISTIFVILAVYYSYILDWFRGIGEWWKGRKNTTSASPDRAAITRPVAAESTPRQGIQSSGMDTSPEVRFRETFRQDLEKGGENGYVYA